MHLYKAYILCLPSDVVVAGETSVQAKKSVPWVASVRNNDNRRSYIFCQ